MSGFSDLLADPPAVPDARADADERRNPICGACRRRLQHDKQWRCPYVRCRAWLRGLQDLADELQEVEHA